MNRTNHYASMFVIIVLSGLLSTMNVWADKIEDIRFSINDIYMILLMSGWMFLFMGLFNSDSTILYVGLLLVIKSICSIRTQFLVTESQYKLGMIPHHSIAVHMSNKLLDKKTNIAQFAKNIIETQEDEIIFMKTDK